MAKQTANPQQLKKILIALLVLLILGSAGLFYLGLGELKGYAVEVNHRLQDAEASGQQIDQLQALKGQMDQSQLLIGKAEQLFSSPAEYQTKALTDLQAIASHTGVTIAGTEFSDGANPGNSHTVTVRLSSPVSYSKLIAFFDGVESNLPKMQVTSASLGHVTDGNADAVKVEAITIKLTVQ